MASCCCWISEIGFRFFVLWVHVEGWLAGMVERYDTVDVRAVLCQREETKENMVTMTSEIRGMIGRNGQAKPPTVNCFHFWNNWFYKTFELMQACVFHVTIIFEGKWECYDENVNVKNHLLPPNTLQSICRSWETGSATMIFLSWCLGKLLSRCDLQPPQESIIDVPKEKCNTPTTAEPWSHPPSFKIGDLTKVMTIPKIRDERQRCSLFEQ